MSDLTLAVAAKLARAIEDSVHNSDDVDRLLRALNEEYPRYIFWKVAGRGVRYGLRWFGKEVKT